MNARPESADLTPPEPPGRAPSIAMALVAHAALVGALALGVQWKHSSETPPVMAELWAQVPREAAPREQAPPTPALESPKAVAPPPPVAAPAPSPEADIALEREKRRELLLRERELERERQEALARKRKQEAEQLALRKAQAERAEQERRDRERIAREKDKAARELAREREAKTKLDERRRAEEAARRKAEEDKADAERIESQRQENLKRMAGLAGATGAGDARGIAAQSAGPSAGYGARVQARVRPNIVFADADHIQGNPSAEVEVRTAPDGTILGSPRLVKSSGVKAWDEAVLRAIEKTEVMPRDVDGRVPTPLLIELRPKR